MPDEESESDRIENTISQHQAFHRVDLAWRRKFEEWKLLIAPTFRYVFDDIAFSDIFRLDLSTYAFDFRSELSRNLGKWGKARFGVDMSVGTINVYLRAGGGGGRGGGGGGGQSNIVEMDEDRKYFQPSAYTTFAFNLGKSLWIYPQFRFNYFERGKAGSHRLVTDPRFRLRWQVGKSTVIKAALGKYSQLPSARQMSSGLGNPLLGAESAIHSSVAVEQTFSEGTSIGITGFYNEMWDLAVRSTRTIEGAEGPVFERFDNLGLGRTYGLELLIRKPLSRRFFGWISYTLMKSERKSPDDDGFVLFDQDQTHILSVVASYKLPRNWQIGGRFRLVSGNPTTERNAGIFNNEQGSFIPVDGPENGSRVPMFHQLDIRVDKTWVFKLWKFTTYLDIQNIYNVDNVELFTYSFDFRQKQPVTSLPFLPSFGLKAEY